MSETGNFNLLIEGSQVVSVHTWREELVYSIYENELESLSSHNTISTACFSIAAFVMAQIPLSTFILNKPFEWHTSYTLLLVISVIFFIFGGFHWYKKRGLTQKIKSKSTIINKSNI